ncbi:GNAT family N-acetyltransferase [Micromonospora sp. WMMD710]|uniref:GNAT family N-acetyltransferase n=1 Tax=Micromonospora sp. WMMD710 TaxID=3016085 RepID=UPI002415E43F|nr:GNAT family N-acetyltransferase [Micromonospora sp. WMMD710]MDG4757583.1 GNAT family N-acetyltransferase [Micromonospora sp. WMMD710]
MIRVREFVWSDYNRVVALWTATGRGVLPRAELTTTLTRDPQLFLVADVDATVAAVVLGTYDGRRGMILRLAVDPAYRRRGIATLLVAELERRFAALGCPRVNLLVLPEDTAALRFWQALGYAPQPDVLCTKPMGGSPDLSRGVAPASTMG